METSSRVIGGRGGWGGGAGRGEHAPTHLQHHTSGYATPATTAELQHNAGVTATTFMMQVVAVSHHANSFIHS